MFSPRRVARLLLIAAVLLPGCAPMQPHFPAPAEAGSATPPFNQERRC